MILMVAKLKLLKKHLESKWQGTICLQIINGNNVQKIELFLWMLFDLLLDCIKMVGVKKPAGSAEEIEKHFGCNSSSLLW